MSADEIVHQLLERSGHDRVEQRRLVVEVAENQGLADVGEARDLLGRGGGIATFGEQLPGRLADALGDVLARAAAAADAKRPGPVVRPGRCP